MPDRVTWEWLAGFFDGEGSVSLRMGRNRSTPICTITQAGTIGRIVLEDVSSFLCVSGIKHQLYINRSGEKQGWQTKWGIQVQGYPQVKPLLEHLLPYLKVKRTAAQDVLRFVKIYPSAKDCAWIFRETSHAR